MSQPAVSQGIKKLENLLELELLNHRHNRIQPTRDGRLLIEKCQPVFVGIKNLWRSVESMKNVASGSLKLGVSNSISKAILGPPIKRFLEKYPKVDLQFSLGNTDRQLAELLQGKIDLGITIDHGALGGCYKKEIKKGSFRLLKVKKSASRLILTLPRPETKALLQNLKKSNVKFDLPPLIVDSWTVIHQMVALGVGVGLLPDFWEDPKIHSRVCTNGDLDYSLVAFSLQDLDAFHLAHHLFDALAL